MMEPMRKRKRPTLKADEHPRPQVMVPMSLFGTPPFSGNYALVGEFIHWCCHAVWKKDPRFIAEKSFDEDTIGALVHLGFLVKRRGVLFLAGPFRDPQWLTDVKRTWITYAIEAVEQNTVKVGHTTDIERRLDELQCASAYPLRIIGMLDGDHEKRLHRLLRSHWRSGEWFALNDEVLAILRAEGLLRESEE